ncbi:bone morphogenetic protein 15 [Carettochelys insculpta]|uniref:bone morphogenetic protein 15 n=1 Tax=Carettochelys insculpta TaxID=44489 RepID=UPI003EBE831A
MQGLELAMTTLCSLGCWFLLVTLLPLVLSGGEEAAAAALAGAPSLPLIQELLEQGPSGWPQGRRKELASRQPLYYMLNLYRSMANWAGRPRRGRELGANAVRLVRPFAEARQSGAGLWFRRTLNYHLTIQPEAEHLVRATVVYATTLRLAHARFLCVVQLPGERGAPERTPPRRSQRQALVSSAPDSWAQRDITARFLPWAWASKQSQLLRLTHLCVQRGAANGSEPAAGWGEAASSHDPFLLLYLNDTRPRHGKAGWKEPPEGPALSRKARQAGSLLLDIPSYARRISAPRDECALRSFRVSFSQLGWDHWIIAPHRYNPRYCKGTCPRVLRYGYHAPNHAVVQNFINQLVDQSVPRPSCVPYKYSPISVLMLEASGSILYKEYEDMIADSCTCR